jgi:hypothetical protein
MQGIADNFKESLKNEINSPGTFFICCGKLGRL